MIPMSELLKDPAYRRFITRLPEVPTPANNKVLSPMWVVYVRLKPDSPWKRKSFRSYKKAFKFFNKARKVGVYDLAINNKRIYYDPPSRFVRIKGKFVIGSDGVKRQATKLVEWKPRLSAEDADHEWCGYCRRPVEFKYYNKHAAIKRPDSLWDIPLDNSVRRCCICGASERIAIPWQHRRF